MSEIVGRSGEYKRLLLLKKSSVANMVAIKGRRRVGKSTLVEKFAESFSAHYTFTGLAPEPGITNENQKQEFCRQYAAQFSVPVPTYNDWGDIFWSLADKVKSGRVLLFLDEISWMAEGDATFLPKLKDAWDRFFKKNAKLILVVCGSASSWIDKNILSSTAFVGRISLEMTIKPLPLDVCKAFWRGVDVSAYEVLKVLAVTGGIPRYLEAVQPRLSAEDNIKHLCFMSGGLLVNEFEKIFNDLFLHETDMYRRIVLQVAEGAKQFSEICDSLGVAQSGKISEYLYELEEAGFIRRHYSWSMKTGLDTRISVYRLSDNYLRFYFKYIEPHRNRIRDNRYVVDSVAALPGWTAMLALQIESLVINNRQLLIDALSVPAADIIADGPYFQRATKKIPGCQIDYLLQTKFNTLYVCEIKFSKRSQGQTVIDDVKEKIKRLVVPKGFSVRAVLLHVNGVDEAVEDSGFFAEILDISEWV